MQIFRKYFDLTDKNTTRLSKASNSAKHTFKCLGQKKTKTNQGSKLLPSETEKRRANENKESRKKEMT